MVCTGKSDVHQDISMYCLAQDDCNVFTFDIIYGFVKFKNVTKTGTVLQLMIVCKISFISTFREEYLLCENVIFIYLNVQ